VGEESRWTKHRSETEKESEIERRRAVLRQRSSPRDHDPWSNGKGRSVLHGAARRRATTTTTTKTTRTTVGRTFIRNGGSASVTNGAVSLLCTRTPGPARQAGPLTRRRKSDHR